VRTFSQFIFESLKPAQRVSYKDFRKFPEEKNYFFQSHTARREFRNNPNLKHWVVFSLGSSFHDPQEMYKVVSGPKVPEGVQEITTALELRAAWRYIQDERNLAYSYSRASGY